VVQDSLGRSPISVNLRSLHLYVEDLSRRDSVKVEAQYEVLGNDAKRHERPGRDDRRTSGFGLARRSEIANFGRSSRSSFVVLTMADKPGQKSSPVQSQPLS
jgi:hypothetical protein